MRYLFQLSSKIIVVLGALALSAFVSSTALGCAPRAQTVTLDVPSGHPVSVAPPELGPGAAKVTAIDAPFGGWKYKEKNLEVLHEMLEETNPMPGAPGESFRIHLVIRRFLVAYYYSEAVGISCVAWALTNPRGELIFDETFYAAVYTENKGVNGVKNPIHQGITKRVHTVTQAVASGLPAGPPPTWVYEDYEAAAAAMPDGLGRIVYSITSREGTTRGVKYVGETGEEFARCVDSIDWYYRLGIPRPAEEPSPVESTEEPPPTISQPPGENPAP